MLPPHLHPSSPPVPLHRPDNGNRRVQVFDRQGKFKAVVGAGRLAQPIALAAGQVRVWHAANQWHEHEVCRFADGGQ